jgi:osomolarity two-component system phosphorelay intermediate protein YPD1
MDDDDEDRDFSKSIVYGFFDQAESTFEKIQKGM